MHLAIDLRFYKPEPYGLSFYIDGLFGKLTPLLLTQNKYSKITLILHPSTKTLNLNDYLSWWPLIEKNTKFEILYSNSEYYTISEQTVLLKELNTLKPDLVYFFTFNYPILYRERFIYQVLDLTPIKESFQGDLNFKKRLKIWLMRRVLKFGFNNSSYNLFLGSQTPLDSENLLGLNFSDESKSSYKKNKVIWAGLNSSYTSQNLAVAEKEKLFLKNKSKLSFDYKESLKLVNLKEKLRITKPYFLFVSVWKSHKNIDRLIEAFNIFQSKNQNKYQLVLAGSVDQKNRQILDKIDANDQFKKGNILLAQKLPNDDLVRLHDGSNGLIMPSLSEGFGLSLIEAASRMNLVICSDLFIFRDILGESAIYFNPLSIEDMAEKWTELSLLTELEKQRRQENLFKLTEKFNWPSVASEILEVILKV